MRFGFHHHGHDRGEERGGRHGFHAMRGEGRGLRGGGGRWGFGGPDGWDEGGRPGGRRRVFDGGELRLVLLRLIGDQPRHGYDLIRAIEEQTGGAYAPSPGVVYPTLTLLGDMGQIEEQASEGNRKLFAVTPEGQRLLDEKADEIAALMSRLSAMGQMRERTEGASIRRAMHNLKIALHNSLSRDDVDADRIHAAVALIDEAAQRIERL